MSAAPSAARVALASSSMAKNKSPMCKIPGQLSVILSKSRRGLSSTTVITPAPYAYLHPLARPCHLPEKRNSTRSFISANLIEAWDNFQHADALKKIPKIERNWKHLQIGIE